MRNLILSLCLLLQAGATQAAAPLPGPPTVADHPGSKVYSFNTRQTDFSCNGRAMNLFLPDGAAGLFPLVVFGHGQALDASHYKATFEHLAKKGIAVLHPAYDNGFFDQDWTRMGNDYLELTRCALEKFPNQLDRERIVFAGHSKGAYIASIAAGLAFDGRSAPRPKAIVLLEPAGADEATLPKIGRETSLTVVFSDADTIVSRAYSETIFQKAGSGKRQFILLKSYTLNETDKAVKADHMWPLTKGSFFGGGPEGPLHYYGSWKWLVAAARDLSSGGRFDEPYLYGPEAVEKGVPGFLDEIRKN